MCLSVFLSLEREALFLLGFFFWFLSLLTFPSGSLGLHVFFMLHVLHMYDSFCLLMLRSAFQPSRDGFCPASNS